ncbi:hypothetical protein RJT34_13547 [Clitoria ternatea]|uniref:Apple domain-containing protein n=1 Tax=Clitoria ternatea TaxID=43366 RepID=A0AAN9JQU5_CLITE
MEYHGLPEIFLWNKQLKVYRSGSWNGQAFTSLPVSDPKALIQNETFVADAHEVFYSIAKVERTKHTRVTIEWTGEVQRLIWGENGQSWIKLWYGPKDECDKYPRCGPYTICNSNIFPVCNCIHGFHVKNQDEWNLRTFSGGCVRNTALDCGKDQFQLVHHAQPPETTMVFVNRSMSLVECADMCTKNCSCTAYANVEITNGGTGCVMWTDNGETAFAGSSSKKNNMGKVVGIAVGVTIVILGASVYILWKKRKLHSVWKWKISQKGDFERNQHPEAILLTERDSEGEGKIDEMELPLPQLSVTSNEVVYWDEPGDRLARFLMQDDGLLQRYMWDNKVPRWVVMYEARKDFCDSYGACGVNGVCNIKDVPFYCDCLKGFTPKSQQDWDSFERSGGCIRRTPLNCIQGDKFQKLSWVKLPMLSQFWTNNSMTLEECKVECLKNCSCTAYANSAMNGGHHGCLLWFGNLVDIKLLMNQEGEQLDLYLRLAASEIAAFS